MRRGFRENYTLTEQGGLGLAAISNTRGVPLNYGELERWTRLGYEREPLSDTWIGEVVTMRLNNAAFTIAEATC